jgi:hypothetical protein
MTRRNNPEVKMRQIDPQRLRFRTEILRNRVLRRWLVRSLRRLARTCAVFRAEGELRAMDARELIDLGLDQGSIGYAVRHGRELG